MVAFLLLLTAVFGLTSNALTTASSAKASTTSISKTMTTILSKTSKPSISKTSSSLSRSRTPNTSSAATVTVTHTKIITASAASATCPTPSTPIMSVGFGADPLLVTGSGNFLDASTPYNQPRAASGGSGLLRGNFAAANSTNAGGEDILQVAAINVTVTPNTAYLITMDARYDSSGGPGGLFCQLWVTGTNIVGGEGHENLDFGKWRSFEAGWQTTDTQTQADVIFYSRCFNNGVTGVNGTVRYYAYSVSFDNFVIAPDVGQDY